MKPLVFVVMVLCAGCVTSNDLLRVESKVEAISADGVVTERERDELQEEIRAVAEEVEQRTGDLLEDLAATGGLTGLLTAFGLNVYRNSTRRKELAEVKSTSSKPTS